MLPSDAQTSIVWKAFDRHANGSPLFLFHALNGTRIVTLDEWVRANVIVGRDGRGDRWYETGFHVINEWSVLEQWARTLAHDKWVARVRVPTASLRRKTHSPLDIFLADALFVSQHDWDAAFILRAGRA